MRNPNFRLRGLWPRQYGGGGGVPGGASGVANFPAKPDGSAYSYTIPASGSYLFVAWGAGGFGGVGGLAQNGGGSGAYLEITKTLSAGQVVSIRPGRTTPATEHTTVTFPDSSVATAGHGQDNIAAGGPGGAGGVATGGDFMINGAAGALNGAAGAAGGGTGGGPGTAAVGGFPPANGAPARLPFRGGAGTNDGPGTPGGSGISPNPGGSGMVLVVRVS